MHIKNLKQVEATIDFDKVYDDRMMTESDTWTLVSETSSRVGELT